MFMIFCFIMELTQFGPIMSTGRRTFLSDAYACTGAWNERLQAPVLQKVDVGKF